MRETGIAGTKTNGKKDMFNLGTVEMFERA